MATSVSVVKRNVLKEKVDGQIVFLDDNSLSRSQSFPFLLNGLTNDKLKEALKKQTPSKWEAQTPFITSGHSLASLFIL